MPETTNITFQGIDPSDAITARIHERIARLEAMSPELHTCDVWVRAPNKKHKATQYVIDLSATLPGSTLAITRRPGDDTTHTDVYLAIRDAFNAMERKLRKWSETHKGRPETHVQPLQGRIAMLNGHSGYGHIKTTDGREIYFHRNAVDGDGFDALNTGDTVELSLDSKGSEKGPHASFVRPIGALRFTDTPR